MSQSLYLHDPDGNEVELYIDVQGVNWEQNPMLALSPTNPHLSGRYELPFTLI